MYKKNVLHALNALRDTLIHIGANPHRIDLPRPPGVLKVGVDDFIVSHGKKAEKAFDALPNVSLFLGSGITGAALLARKFEPTQYVVPGLIPEGLSILAGKPKIGKSWFALALVVAVASGTRALDFYNPEKAEVLYLALEDSELRLQNRLKKIASIFSGAENAYFYCTWNRVEESGLLALERWLLEHPKCRLVVIDTLAKVRKPPRNGNSYYEDYEAVSALKGIADKFKIAVVVIHHTRKQESDDPFDLISGTTGITGSADTNIVLMRDHNSQEGILYITGRDVTEQELAMSYVDCAWKVLGKAAQVYTTRTQQEIIAAIIDAGEPLTPNEIGAWTNRKPGGLSKTLDRMLRENLLSKPERGKYQVVEHKSWKFAVEHSPKENKEGEV